MDDFALEMVRRSLTKEGVPGFDQSLHGLLISKGYRLSEDEECYLRNRSDRKIDYLEEGDVLRHHFNHSSGLNHELSYLCFEGTSDIAGFIRRKNELQQLVNQEGLTHRGNGSMDRSASGYVNNHTGQGAYLGAMVGLVGAAIPGAVYFFNNHNSTVDPDKGILYTGIILGGTALGGIIGGLIGRSLVKKRVAAIKQKRSDIIAEYNALFEEFKAKYEPRVSYGITALEKALE